jgi:hypothetical protein
MIGYLSVYVSQRALKPSRATLRRLFIRVHLSMGMKPSRATLRQLLIRVRLSMGIETLRSYTLLMTFAHCASSLSHDDNFLLIVSS